MPAHWILRLFGFGLLLGLNGFFVAAEYALITASPALAGTGRGARSLARLRQQLDLLLSATQLGVTLCALGLGWAIGPRIGEWLGAVLPAAGPGWAAERAMGLAAAGFLLVTAADIVLAEIVPKRIALLHSQRVALAVALPMEAFLDLTRPFLRLIGGLASAVLRLLGAGTETSAERVHSAGELKLLARASLTRGHLEPVQEEIIRRVLELESAPVREIMTPRPQVMALPLEATLEQAWELIAAHARSRLPVYHGDLDHLAGVLNAKDLLRALHASRGGRAAPPLRSLLRRLPVVPESKPIDQMLEQFRHGAHMAAVVDEWGTFTGVVTIEDVLEQIVGEMRDEFDLPLPLDDGFATAPVQELAGWTPIRDLEAILPIRFPRDQPYETLAGFVLSRLHRLPQGGERVEWEGHRFTVLAVEGRRIARVRIELAAGAS